jgi:hypothetical protein
LLTGYVVKAHRISTGTLLTSRRTEEDNRRSWVLEMDVSGRVGESPLDYSQVVPASSPFFPVPVPVEVLLAVERRGDTGTRGMGDTGKRILTKRRDGESENQSEGKTRR